MTNQNLEHFRRRAEEERAAAAAAKDERVRVDHARLAAQYEKVVDSYNAIGRPLYLFRSL